jgi:putative ABC transport system ATP-binding protein
MTQLIIKTDLWGKFRAEGSVEIDGVSKWKPSIIQKVRRLKIGYVFQNYGLIENDTAKQNLLLTSKFVALSKQRKQEAFVKALLKVDLDEGYLERKIYSLSGGEQQRLAIARLFITKPKYIFADEPTGNLDHENAEIVFKQLENFVKKGHTVIYVSHNEELIKQADKVVFLERI